MTVVSEINSLTNRLAGIETHQKFQPFSHDNGTLKPSPYSNVSGVVLVCTSEPLSLVYHYPLQTVETCYLNVVGTVDNANGRPTFISFFVHISHLGLLRLH